MKCLCLLFSSTEDGCVATVTTHSSTNGPLALSVACEMPEPGFRDWPNTMFTWMFEKLLINIKALFNYCVLLEEMLQIASSCFLGLIVYFLICNNRVCYMCTVNV